jgi:hypothetical protein
MLGGALEDARTYYGADRFRVRNDRQRLSCSRETTVADTLMATSRVYDLFQTVIPVDDSVQQIEAPEDQTESEDDDSAAAERMKQRQAERMPERRDARELFNAWNDPSQEGEPDELAARTHGPKARRPSKCWLKAKWPLTTTSGIAS